MRIAGLLNTLYSLLLTPNHNSAVPNRCQSKEETFLDNILKLFTMMKPMKNDYGKPTLLNEQDLGILLEDLLDISNSSNFGSKFEVLLAEPERFEKLVFRISSSIMKQGVKIIVVMQEYPASKFELLPTNDPICIELIQLANDDLRNKKRKIRLLDILKFTNRGD